MGYKIIGLVVMLSTHLHVIIRHMLDVQIYLLKKVRQNEKNMKSLLPHLNVQSTQKT